MLANANATSGQFSGVGEVWQSPFAIPNPAAAMAKSSVWFTAIHLDDHQARPLLSQYLGETRICGWHWRLSASSAVHTGPLKRAGGLWLGGDPEY